MRVMGLSEYTSVTKAAQIIRKLLCTIEDAGYIWQIAHALIICATILSHAVIAHSVG